MTKLNALSNPVSKLEAARRQLDFAIRAYVNDEDALPLHTLAYASLTVLLDYDKKTNRGANWAKLIRESPHNWSREIANFLKHADRDPLAEIPDISPFIPEYVLLMAARLYAQLTEEPTPEMEAFSFLMRLKFKAERQADKGRDRWDSYYDEDKLLRAEIQRQAEHKARLKFGKEMIDGKTFIPPTLITRVPELGDPIETWDADDDF